MNQPQPHKPIRSLDMIQQIISDATQQGSGDCGGDCANCPCSGEEPKSTKKTSEKETGDHCDKG
ncbi:MAG: hypothetical protein AB8C95_06230 [Phycisphaeraceae bacterium]